MPNACLQRGALRWPLVTFARFFRFLTYMPRRLFGCGAPHAHVIELVAHEYFGVAADVYAGCSNLRPYYLAARTGGDVPHAQTAIAAAAHYNLAFRAQTQREDGVGVASQSELPHLAPASGVEKADCVVEGAADDDLESG